MLLTIKETEKLLEIIQRNVSTNIGRSFGMDFLTNEDIERLEKAGVDIEKLYDPFNDTIFTSYNLGMLSNALNLHPGELTFENLHEYIKSGNYIPMSKRDKLIQSYIKRQAFNDVKALEGRIFRDVNQVLLDSSLASQKQFLSNETAEGLKDKKTVRQIANKIAEKTGDWSRDFDRIIEFASSSAFEYAKVENLENTYGETALVWRRVYTDACKHCIRLYLTDGIGSEPKLFTIKELRVNGTNIGRKSADWKPVIGATHPYCRCTWNHAHKSAKWDPDKQLFIVSITGQDKRKRPLIKVKIGDRDLLL